MLHWERRYGHGMSGRDAAAEHARFDRVKNLAIILLAALLVGTAIVCAQTLKFRDDCGETFIARMKTECSSAVSTANNLSRSGGSDSAAMLARIRANVRTMEVVNEMQRTLTGSPYVEADVFGQLYSLVDSYYDRLKTSTSTISEQTNLVNSLTDLQTAVLALE